MLRKLKTTRIPLFISLIFIQSTFAITLKLGYTTYKGKQRITQTSPTEMGDTVTIEDIREKFETEDLKKKTDTRGQHLDIYLIVPKKAKNSIVQELKPLNEVTTIKENQKYVYRTAVKLKYKKHGKEKTTFLDISPIGNDNVQTVEFCRENGLEWGDMEDDGAGGFIDKRIKNKPQDDGTNNDKPPTDRSKIQKILIIGLIGTSIVGGGLLFWRLQAANKEEKKKREEGRQNIIV